MKKFTLQDEFAELDSAIAEADAAALEVVQFKNYMEHWEADALRSKSVGQCFRLMNKYKNINFFDEDVAEHRTVTDLEWSERVPSQRRGAPATPAQYSLVTQLLPLPLAEDGAEQAGQVEIGDDTLQPYYVNAFVFDMITKCSENSTHNESFQLIHADEL